MIRGKIKFKKFYDSIPDHPGVVDGVDYARDESVRLQATKNALFAKLKLMQEKLEQEKLEDDAKAMTNKYDQLFNPVIKSPDQPRSKSLQQTVNEEVNKLKGMF